MLLGVSHVLDQLDERLIGPACCQLIEDNLGVFVHDTVVRPQDLDLLVDLRLETLSAAATDHLLHDFVQL